MSQFIASVRTLANLATVKKRIEEGVYRVALTASPSVSTGPIKKHAQRFALHAFFSFGTSFFLDDQALLAWPAWRFLHRALFVFWRGILARLCRV